MKEKAFEIQAKGICCKVKWEKAGYSSASTIWPKWDMHGKTQEENSPK